MIDFQKIHDWYICNIEDLKDFYSRNLHKFWKRKGLVAVTGEHGFLDMELLPFGYSTFELNDKLIESTRKGFEKASKRY